MHKECTRVMMMEAVKATDLHEVLDGGAEVASDRKLLERQHHRPPGVLAGVAPRKHVPKLRVRKLVQPSRCADLA
jgi:hypothetical protein